MLFQPSYSKQLDLQLSVSLLVDFHSDRSLLTPSILCTLSNTHLSCTDVRQIMEEWYMKPYYGYAKVAARMFL